jgi:hypothetical protein
MRSWCRVYAIQALPCAAFAAVGDTPTAANISSFVTHGIAVLGTFAATALAGYAGYMVVKKGLPWLLRSLG